MTKKQLGFIADSKRVKASDQWQNMPEYNCEHEPKPKASAVFNFESEEDLKKFELDFRGTCAANYSRKRRQKLAATQPQKKLDLSAEAISYVSSVHKKLSANAPEYDPRGHYLDNKDKWGIKLKTGKTITARGTHKQWLGWTNDGLKVSCEYTGSAVPSAKQVLKRANKASNKLNNR